MLVSDNFKRIAIETDGAWTGLVIDPRRILRRQILQLALSLSLGTVLRSQSGSMPQSSLDEVSNALVYLCKSFQWQWRSESPCRVA